MLGRNLFAYRSRSDAEGDGRDFEAAAINATSSPGSNIDTPLDSPTDAGNKGRGYGSEDGLLPVPAGPPSMERVNSSSSLTG